MYVRGWPWHERAASYQAGYPGIDLPAVTEAELVETGAAPGVAGGSVAPGAAGNGAPGLYRAQSSGGGLVAPGAAVGDARRHGALSRRPFAFRPGRAGVPAAAGGYGPRTPSGYAAGNPGAAGSYGPGAAGSYGPVGPGAPGVVGNYGAPGAAGDYGVPGAAGNGVPSGLYRAQFAYRPAPAGFHDEDFTHFYNAISTPALGMTITAGDTLKDIPLVLETDADFIARGIRIMGQARFQFREPSGLWLSEQYPAPPPHLVHSYQAGGLDLLPAGTFELPTVPLEPGIGCLAGSAFLLYLYNPAAIPVAVNGWVAIFGMKRYANGC